MTKQITVYQTDEDGLFLHPTTANELSQQPGAFNVPYGARITQPPAAPPGMVAQATGESWALVEDHRKDKLYRTDNGEEYGFGTTIIIDGVVARYAGWGTVPEWLTVEAPVNATDGEPAVSAP